ncbi:FadR family transcriptional regulator [Blastococcus sp. CT_GayMR20]|uniref:FadR/GntR family transcriptional regulator n=1 Tax=Blastococcus sp. CT_GayMR20 TaxID=2559609 RepID=UPI001073E41B|nr:FadR/GntR family transcriptional regulator [Blastococcus sp. CT_GayMR20]TFV93788.1 FadR family transcriptional regulator [Blastococcus sp. CT_GayMR20]TFV93807.1 FadR family transcriptional regulator [Blastococcus sp. CT_GayMR20]
MTHSIRPQKMALIVAQRIVRDIEREGLGPGDKLPPERVMMETYEAGRGTLRESLRFLELQGVLSFKPGPGGGPVIEKPTADNLATTLTLLLQFDGARYQVIAEAREAFEPVMAQLAASRITPEHLVQLEQTVTDMADNLEDVEVYLDANRRFHNVIAWASGNALFGHLVDVMGGAMDISGAAQGIQYPLKRRQAVLKAHQEIFEAIRNSEPEQAEKSMRTHIDEYLVYASRKYPDALDKPIRW